MLSGVVVIALLLSDGQPSPHPPAASPQPSPSPARRDALARYGAGLWKARRDRLLSAARAFEAAANADPDATAPRRELVRIYSLIGREPEAIRIARGILEDDPDDADTAHRLANLLVDAGELKEAAEFARMAVAGVEEEMPPDRALALYRDAATILDRAEDSGGAAEVLQYALDLLVDGRKEVLASGLYTRQEIDAEAAEIYERLGKVHVKQRKPDEAIAAFKAAYKLSADRTRANDPGAAARLDWNLSSAYESTGDFATALSHLEQFLKLRPLALEPYEKLASLLRKAGRDAEVIPAIQKHFAREPKNQPLLTVLASELARDPLTRVKADSYFAQITAATNDPKIIRAVIRSRVQTDRASLVVSELDLAYQTLHEKENTVTAEKRAFAAEKARVITEVLRAEPVWAMVVLRAATVDLHSGTRRDSRTWQILGSLAAHHGKLDLAAVQLREAARNAPGETQAHAYAELIGVLWRLRQPADVAAVCRNGLRESRWQVAPVFFHFHLALALAELGEADEALAAADKAILQAGDTDRLVVRLRKVAVLKALGKWDEAVRLCKKLLDEFEGPADRARIRYALSSAYWGGKKHAEAEAELRGILDGDPDHAAACNDLGYHLAEQGRNFDEAERLVRHAIAVDRADRRRSGDPEPENPAYLDSLAWVLFRKGKLTEARDLLDRVAAMPDGAGDATVWDHLGDVCFRSGDKDRAHAAWEKAASLLSSESRGPRDGRLDEINRKLKLVP
jgi:tetratricopeptide (TPR) repeat protein